VTNVIENSIQAKTNPIINFFNCYSQQFQGYPLFSLLHSHKPSPLSSI